MTRGEMSPEELKAIKESINKEGFKKDEDGEGAVFIGDKKEVTKLRENAEKQEIMGKNFFGEREIKEVFGFEISQSEIPPIPYSIEQLKQAKKLGESLILRISHDAKGNPMTLQTMNENVPSITNWAKDRNLFYRGGSWYQDLDFIKKDSLKTEWKLVGGSPVSDSVSKKDKKRKGIKNLGGENYAHQTRLLREYLKSVGSLTESEEQECSDEVLRQLSEQMDMDWDSHQVAESSRSISKIQSDKLMEVSRKLVELQININHRRRPVEIVYDRMLFEEREKNNKGAGKNEVSNTFSKGGIVQVSYSDREGARFQGYFPDSSSDTISVR